MIIGGFIVALLTAALVAPLLINWTNYRAEFEAQASAILGRPVKVAGEASARLIPFPSVTFHDVRVGDDPDNPMLTAERFSMDAELAPFLSGEVLIFDMRVTKPTGLITLDAEGVADWTIRPQSPVNPSQIRIENLVVEGGHFTLDDLRAGRRHEITDVNATVSARALTGPWRLTGAAQFDGEPLVVSLTSGSLSSSGQLPLATTVTPVRRNFVVEADGTVRSDKGRMSWTGGFAIRNAKLTDKTEPVLRGGDGRMTGSQVTGTQAKQGGWEAKGKFALDAGKLDLPEIRLETGGRDNPYISNGRGVILFGKQPMFDLSLEGAQVTFDGETQDEPSASDPLGQLRKALGAIPMPDMRGTVTFNLPAIVAGDTTVRDIGFSATPENGAWKVRDFRATLPGRTRVEADGLFSGGERFGFEGRLTVASSQPAGLSNWLTGGVDASVRNFKALGFAADVTLLAKAQTFRNLELAIGASLFKGEAERRTDGIRPAIRAALRGGDLPFSALEALGLSILAPDGTGRFQPHDLALELDAGPIDLNGATAETLGLSLRYKGDSLDVDRLLIGKLNGATISATGAAGNLKSAIKIDADATLISADAAGFVTFMASRLAPDSDIRAMLERFASVDGILDDMRANLVVSTRAEGGIRSLTASYSAKTAGGNQSMTGTVSGEGFAFSPGEISTDAVLSESDPLKLLALAGIEVLPVEIDGPGEVSIKANGRISDGLSVDARYTQGDTKADWSGTVTGGKGVEGHLKLHSGDFDPYLQASGWAFAGAGTGTPVELAADVLAKDGKADFSALSLKAGAAVLSGNARVTTKDARPRLTGSLEVKTLDGTLLAESLFGPTGLVGAEATFPAFALLPLDADLALTVRKAFFPPIGTASDLNAGFFTDAGTVRLSAIKAELAGGRLTGSIEARNDGGTGAVSAEFSLSGADAQILTGTPAPGGTADLSGSFSGSAKSMAGLVSNLNGSGVVRLVGAGIPGLNPDGFEPVARLASNMERAPANSEVDALIGGPLTRGTFPLSSEPMAWSVSNGRIRIPSVRGESAGAKLEAELEASLQAWNGTLRGMVDFDAGKAAVVGASAQLPFQFSFAPGTSAFKPDAQPLMQFLTQSALEREQVRVEAMHAGLIEKQRLRRDVRRIALLYGARQARADAREQAVRTQKAKEAAVLAQIWHEEKMRRLAQEKAKRELEAARIAAKKAEDQARQLSAPDAMPDALQQNDIKQKTLDWLKLKLN